MVKASQEFDEQLFTLKLSELSQELQAKSVASDGKAGGESRKTGGSHLMKIVDGQLELLREWLEGVDRICREVWKIQGKAVTPEFVRDVLQPQAFTVIEARKGSVMSSVSLTALRTRAEDPHAAQSHLAKEINALTSRVNTRYEIEARTLGHKTTKTKPRLPEPVRTVSTALTSPAFGSRDPRPTGVPPNPPMYFPMDLWPQTNVILLESQRKFPLQAQTLELCKHVTAEMTPVFCEAVRGGKIKASSVLQEGCGGMEDLLHSLLVYNDDESHSGFSSLSDKAYHLGQEVRRTDEWLSLAKATAEIRDNSPGAERLRTGAKQAESSLAQNNGKTTQRVVDGKPTADDLKVRIGRNIEKLRKECGWSLDKLADKTGIDKKAILSHVHGKSKPNPGTQKEYAQAFAKELNRLITANNLEE